MAQIEKLRYEIATRDAYAKDLLVRYDCADADELHAKITLLRYDIVQEQKKKDEVEHKNKTIHSLDDLLEEYQQILSTIPPGLRAELEKEQDLVDYRLVDRDPQALMDPEVYEKALARVDERITEIKAQGNGEGREKVAEKSRAR